MKEHNDIERYSMVRAPSRDEAFIWVLLFVVVLFAFLGSALFGETRLFIFSAIVFSGMILSFVFESLVDAKTKTNLAFALSRLANIIAEVSEGIVIYDSEFRIAVINKKAEEILDVRAEDVMNKRISLSSPEALVYPKLSQILFPSIAKSAVLRSAPGSYPNITDISFTDPARTVRVLTNRLFDARGIDLGFIKVMHDRTEDEQIISSKGEFLTVAAHQLRTPLTAINWALESLRDAPELSSESRSFVDAASKTAHKLSDIINDLLEAARIEGGKTEYHRERINLCDLIQSVIVEEEILGKEHGVLIESFLPGEPVMILGDAIKISLALSNLIENGVLYNKKGGSVSVSLAVRSYDCEIIVKDTGLGVSDDDMRKLFSKFFRGDNVVRQETEGSGLGLFITKNIIEAHGGSIRAESTLGVGTTFFITLPLAP